jgi:hypothetical protein
LTKKIIPYPNIFHLATNLFSDYTLTGKIK